MATAAGTITRNARGGRRRFLGILAGIVLATLFLDGLVFGHLVFAPTNRTSWDSFPWYNFEMQYRRLLRERDAVPADHRYVLVVGSSIAKYSVQKRELEAALNGDVTVGVFSHAAMLPTDLSFYVDRIRSLRPDLVVYLTGPADLDLERYAPPTEITGAGSAARPGYDNAAAKTFVANRHPMRVFYPRDFARRAVLEDPDSAIPLEQALRLGFRESLYSLRFEDAWWDPLVFNLKAGSRLQSPGAPVRSYLNYLGVPVPEGLWREGHTISQFSFSLRRHRAAFGSDARARESIFVQIPGALSGVPGFHLKIFTSFVGGLPVQSERAATRFEPERGGWQAVPLPEVLADLELAPDSAADAIITVQLSHVMASVLRPDAPPVLAVREAPLLPGDADFARYAAALAENSHHEQDRAMAPDRMELELYRDAAIDRSSLAKRLTIGRGLRLPGNFGIERLPAGQAYKRRPAWEDWRLAAMNEAQYRADFAARIEPVDWREPRHLAFRQLNQIRLAKYYTNWYRFQPELQQLQDLARFARDVTAVRGQAPIAASMTTPDETTTTDARAHRSRLLLVNNPENPLTLAAYDDNRWYRDYLEHMRGLASAGGPSLSFADHRRRLPANQFLDTHHLSYGGLQAMAPVYAADILRALDDE